MNSWGLLDQVQQYGFCIMGKENLLIRGGAYIVSVSAYIAP